MISEAELMKMDMCAKRVIRVGYGRTEPLARYLLALVAEVRRLRAALKNVALVNKHDVEDDGYVASCEARDLARAALAEPTGEDRTPAHLRLDKKAAAMLRWVHFTLGLDRKEEA